MEFVRHRVFSFAQESTRYCNYSKGKFNNELTFIEPCWATNMDIFKEDPGVTAEFTYDYTEQEKNISASAILFEQLEGAEKSYLELIKRGWKPEQARIVLPNALKTELVMTGFISDWKYLFRLRTSFIAETGKPHPDMSNLCDPLYKEFVKRGFIEK